MQFDVLLCFFLLIKLKIQIQHCLQRPHLRQQQQQQQEQHNTTHKHLKSCKSDTSKRLKWHVVLDSGTQRFRDSTVSVESWAAWNGIILLLCSWCSLSISLCVCVCVNVSKCVCVCAMHRLINYKPGWLCWDLCAFFLFTPNSWGTLTILQLPTFRLQLQSANSVCECGAINARVLSFYAPTLSGDCITCNTHTQMWLFVVVFVFYAHN